MFFPYSADTQREHEYRQEHAYLVYGLLLACVGVHSAISFMLEPAARMDVMYRFGVVRYDLRWYTFMTCTFLHGGWVHLVGNMYFLWLYGRDLERLLGTWRFALLYVGGALLSMLVHVLTLSPFFVGVPTVGASGAISAVLGAFFVLLPAAKLRCLVFFFLRPLVVTLPACVVLGFWFVGQLYASLGGAAGSADIAFWAHVAGFAAGTAAGTLLHGQSRRAFLRRRTNALRPLADAWAAAFAGRSQDGRTACEAFRNTGSDMIFQKDRPLLTALLERGPRGDRGKMEEALLRAFQKADNAGNHARVVTVYLQMLKGLDRRSMPAFVHRNAGHAAIAVDRPVFAIAAFRRAIEDGLEEGVDVILDRTEAMLRHKFGRDAEANALAMLAGGGKNGECGVN